MPKRRHTINSAHLNVSQIVQRLPLHRQMSVSQTIMVKLSPVWSTWSATYLAEPFAASTTLVGVQNGELTISCESAICASQIKHQQTNLLESLHTG